MNDALQGYSAAQALRSGGREAVRRALLAARARTLAFAAPLDAIPYAECLNPPLWELGHIAWFQEYWTSRNRQRALGVGCDPDHARAPSMLPHADGFYDSSRVAHRTRWALPLPDRAGTLAYLHESLAGTLDLLDRLPLEASDAELYFFRLVAMHEEMHAEAAVYMARTLGLPSPLPARPHAGGRTAELHLPAQRFRLGYPGPGFAFDNELGAHEVDIAAFSIDSQPVSWAQFQRFIDADGYAAQGWWTEEGWHWQQGREPPCCANADPHAPALHLSAHEAQAWCRWAGRRLPTEAEWEAAALTAPGFAWGRAWEWTSTPFRPYPGFTPHPYRDYSMPWFESRLVLRGACDATSPSLAHPRYRNFFEPHRNDIFSGFRTCAP